MVSTFGEQLKTARSARGVSINELAMRVGLTATYLRYMESGQMPAPPVDVVMRVASALKSPATEMLRQSISERESVDLVVVRSRGAGLVALAADIVEAWPMVTDEDVPVLGRVLAAVRGRG